MITTAGGLELIKKLAKRVLPKTVVSRVKAMRKDRSDRREYLLDAERYYRHHAEADNAHIADLAGRQRECQLTKDYHRVEKGLALGSPKRPFGAEVGRRLKVLSGAETGSGYAYETHAHEAIAALENWNDFGTRDQTLTLGFEDMPSAAYDEASTRAFFESRKSIRDFDSERNVSRGLLRDATQLAINTPSVCNRQSWQVHFFEGERAQEVLALQNGNRGFRETIPCVAVVTVDNRLFSGAGERNQPWIEGGLFAMSLVWALHSFGVGTCMLNWSVKNDRSDRLRELISLGDHQSIITMIAIGYPREGLRVARSPRRDVSEVANFG